MTVVNDETMVKVSRSEMVDVIEVVNFVVLKKLNKNLTEKDLEIP